MRRIVVVGAGPAGLAAAKLCLQAGHHVTIYEQESDLGGIWLYSPDSTAHSPLYENMLINNPRQLMEYEDCPFPENLPTFLTGEQVLDYLRSYADGITVESNSKVLSVQEENGEKQWKVGLFCNKTCSGYCTKRKYIGNRLFRHCFCLQWSL